MITLIVLFLVFIVSPILVALRIIKRKEKEKTFMPGGVIIDITPYKLKLKRENGDILFVTFFSKKDWFINRKFQRGKRVSIPSEEGVYTPKDIPKFTYLNYRKLTPP